MTVVDLHALPDRAQRFVVGATLRRELEPKEATGSAGPLMFIVLDELNKYAPREGSHPIKEILLDVAERGRSLGVILIGAQQTATEVERRIVANSRCGSPVASTPPRRAAGVRLPSRGPPPAGGDREAGLDVRLPARHSGAAGRGVPVPGLGDSTVGETAGEPAATGAGASTPTPSRASPLRPDDPAPY